jgi:hypothetical protein
MFNDVTLTVAKLAALFASVAAGAYATARIEPSPAIALFLSFGPLCVVGLWLQKDARRTGVGAVQDLGWSLWSDRRAVRHAVVGCVRHLTFQSGRIKAGGSASRSV